MPEAYVGIGGCWSDMANTLLADKVHADYAFPDPGPLEARICHNVKSEYHGLDVLVWNLLIRYGGPNADIDDNGFCDKSEETALKRLLALQHALHDADDIPDDVVVCTAFNLFTGAASVHEMKRALRPHDPISPASSSYDDDGGDDDDDDDSHHRRLRGHRRRSSKPRKAKPPDTPPPEHPDDGAVPEPEHPDDGAVPEPEHPDDGAVPEPDSPGDYRAVEARGIESPPQAKDIDDYVREQETVLLERHHRATTAQDDTYELSTFTCGSYRL